MDDHIRDFQKDAINDIQVPTNRFHLGKLFSRKWVRLM